MTNDVLNEHLKSIFIHSIIVTQKDKGYKLALCKLLIVGSC